MTRGAAVPLLIIPLQFTYLGPRRAPAKVCREVHDLAGPFATPCAMCDLRHSARRKNVHRLLNAPSLEKKRRSEECA